MKSLLSAGWLITQCLKKMKKKKIEFSHNPFSMPQGELDKIDFEKPLEIFAYQYDIV